MINYDHLAAFAECESHIDTINAVSCSDTILEAAQKLNVTERSVYRILARLKKRHSELDGTPVAAPGGIVPDGYRIRGKSHQTRDEAGNICWVKTERDAERQNLAMAEAVTAMAEEIKPAKAVKAPKQKKNPDLLNCYVITDYHMGMLAWGEETGADWDLDIAEETLVKWFASAIGQSPDADQCVLAQLGDFLHFDSLEAVTPSSRHILDADTRFQKIVRCCIRVCRQVVSMLLRKYTSVHIKWCDANHDPAGSAWMREFLIALYENEPRVTIDNGADTYYSYEWGKTALFFHHGHRRKVRNIDTVFAAKFKPLFGRTEHAYAHMGHLHHTDKIETNLMIVEQHRTLAAPDAYASRGGWISGREANVMTYHRDYGQVGQTTISYKMVQAA